MKVTLVECIQELGGTRRLGGFGGWRSQPSKLQSTIWSMRNQALAAEIAEQVSGHHFELSTIEFIEDKPPRSRTEPGEFA